MGRANVVAFASLISALPACAQDLPTLAPLEIEGLPYGESFGPPDALGPTEAPTISSETVAAFFDAAFDLQRLEHPMVGAVVSVVHDGEVIFQSGYGWADLSGRVPADPEVSLFRIASITKAFVWTGIMQLVERGEIDLDADVNRYLDFRIPDSYEEPIRIRHLLTHTAGFEETWTGWGARNAEDVETLGPSLARLLPARVRPPGEHAAYSNYGAALAGYIIERVSGRPWAEYTETEILLPLGMQSTNVRVRMDSDLRRRHARGYVWRDGRFEATDFGYMHLTPAGLMSSTAADMAKFMLAHLNKGALGDARILREETADRMHSPLFAPYE
ncbi:MAG: beta-lactamase family protein, partial [Gemmatimonadota bacterium]|nr:beta-lactamase family protein [Gemmatimonadota bacterium]